MPPAQHPQALPSFDLALPSDHYKTRLPNLSYPSRPHAHVPWSGSSAPLVFAKTTRAEMTGPTNNSNAQVPTTTNIRFGTWSVPDALHRIRVLVWHNLTMIIRNLKLIKEKLFGVSARSPSGIASV